jgi:hypothetical protein
MDNFVPRMLKEESNLSFRVSEKNFTSANKMTGSILTASIQGVQKNRTCINNYASDEIFILNNTLLLFPSV